MAKANIALSSLFRADLRRVFAKGERDNGFAFAAPVPQNPALTGGAVVEIRDPSSREAVMTTPMQVANRDPSDPVLKVLDSLRVVKLAVTSRNSLDRSGLSAIE
jgi:hypothetical protein